MDLSVIRGILWTCSICSWPFTIWICSIIWRKLKPDAKAKFYFRFALQDLTCSVFALALALACTRYFLLAIGLEQEDMIPVAIVLGPAALIGLPMGTHNHSMLEKPSWALGVLVRLLGAMFSVCMYPAVFLSMLMAMNLKTFHNDTKAVIAWVLMLMPCLGQFWYLSAYVHSRVDKPVD
ncbi:MAG: hypothetical protein KIS92_14195 [Planctomycetota bacterium]|nr:hypothetical protein [Planctomycetota bacterium]